jgi:hypothetical protein
MSKVRIIIPTAPTELIGLCQAAGTEHKAKGKDSPLGILTWDEINPKITEAAAVDSKITGMSRELEQLIERRKILIETPGGLADFARQARDILSGVYRNEMKKLGDFGFEVSDSPKTKRNTERKSLPAPVSN